MPRHGEPQEYGHEDDEEMEQLVASLDEGVGHQLKSRIGLEGLEELQHDGNNIDAHDDLQDEEEHGYLPEVLLARLYDGGVQAHHLLDDHDPRVPLLQDALDGVGVRGEDEDEPQRDVRPTHDDAHPIDTVPEAPVLSAAPAQAALPHAAQELLQLPVRGVGEEEEVDDVQDDRPRLRVGEYYDGSRHDVRHHKTPVVEVCPDLRQAKHADPVIPGGEEKVQRVRVSVVPV
mmetsp:Transcript_18662/g.58603  ORF Transcript_18662/g.58603 Transcript_18662/m.58603 type:complete len:231 (-) Transcript_18662:500-1192(-)